MKIAISVEELTRLVLAMPHVADVAVYDGSNLEVPDEIGKDITPLLIGDELSAAALSARKRALITKVDNAAETERLKYITPGEGQAMTYQQKVDEARAFKSAIDPQPADYPVLFSEVGITAPTLSEVADIVLAAFAQWQKIGASIESIRLGAKRDINAAEDETTACSIFDAIMWPSAQVQA